MSKKSTRRFLVCVDDNVAVSIDSCLATASLRRLFRFSLTTSTIGVGHVDIGASNAVIGLVVRASRRITRLASVAVEDESGDCSRRDKIDRINLDANGES